MPSNTVAVPAGSAIELLRGASTPEETAAAGRAVMELVQLPDVARPVPRFLGDLPWSTNPEQVVDQIILNLLTAADIEKASEGSAPLKYGDLLDTWVVLRDLRVHESAVEDAEWAAYYSLAVERDNGEHLLVNVGAKQVLAVLWRVYVDGLIPCWIKFTELGEPVKGRNRPVGVIVKTSMPTDGADKPF